MKKRSLCIFLEMILYITNYAQISYPGSFEDDYISSNSLKSASSKNSSYGMAFTPKGDFKVLIICAGFGEPYDSYTVPGWVTGVNTFPDWVNNKSTFYTNNSDFNNPATINDKKNVSRFYYEMSKGSFRLTADVYPTRVNINATGSKSFDDLNIKVIEKMKADNPAFDWSIYDKRKNFPDFKSDNSISNPDSIVDYVVITYRFHRDMNDKNSLWYTSPPVPGMYDWPYSGGGVASLLSLNAIKFGNYSFKDKCGYTQSLGSANMFELFIHEVAHTLFDCPHYANANGVAGKYFYNQIGGWGMMNLDRGPFGCANGWERWYLGWIEIQANGVNSGINSVSDFPAYGYNEYILRDHITTGDVVRIKIPNGTGTDQHLWLENHQGKSIYDDRGWPDTDGCNNFPPSARGLVAYIESITGNRNTVYVFGMGANAIKPIHPYGNYDYSYSGSPSDECLWGNWVYNITEGISNPISGQSKIEGLRLNFNQDSLIYVDAESNNPKPPNEYHWVAKRNGTMTYDFMGSDINFKVGQKLSMATNPTLINRPVYDQYYKKLSPFYLNGFSVTIVEKLSNGDIKVRVACNDVNLTSWTGNIILPDITYNSNPDLRVLSNVTLTINKSGTANRHTKTSFGDFINPTVFTCSQNSYCKMYNNSKIIVDNPSAFILE